MVAAPPRRLSVGLERDRLAMLLAVLHRHAGRGLWRPGRVRQRRGRVRISEPAADLAVMLAITSSLRGKALPKGFIASAKSGWRARCARAPWAGALARSRQAGFTVAVP